MVLWKEILKNNKNYLGFIGGGVGFGLGEDIGGEGFEERRFEVGLVLFVLFVLFKDHTTKQ